MDHRQPEGSSMKTLTDPIPRRLLLNSALAGVAAASLPRMAASQSWKPSRPVRLIVTFAPGGPADVLARLCAQLMGERLGQPIVVENRPGAAGIVGGQYVSRATPDGMTLLVGTADSHSIYPHIAAAPLFEPRQQVPVAPLGIVPFGLLVRSDFPANTLQDIQQLTARREVSFATWGVGSAAHAMTILLIRTARLRKMIHVPYTGAAPALQALMGSQVDLVTGPMPMLQANRSALKGIAVMTEERFVLAPDVPTFAEQGFGLSSEGTIWIGIFAPPGTPAEIVQQVSDTFSKVTTQPEVQARLAQLGFVPQQATPAEYASFYAADYERWGRALREAGVRLE
jgi:tripartite-type tricarboxylate transporter receptor subunit TctC